MNFLQLGEGGMSYRSVPLPARGEQWRSLHADGIGLSFQERNIFVPQLFW